MQRSDFMYHCAFTYFLFLAYSLLHKNKCALKQVYEKLVEASWTINSEKVFSSFHGYYKNKLKKKSKTTAFAAITPWQTFK